ncbi:hypothetical protein ABLO27_00335 [Roseibium sp. SCPC15]
MNPHWLFLQFANVVLSVLEFLSSPTGGRDIGRDLLEKIGLRDGGRKRK